MSVSKEQPEKKEPKSGLEILWEVRGVIADLMYNFRECHDLCVQSKLFSDEAILKIDQCAVDFRQLTLDTLTVSKRVSNQWLSSTLLFFENIDDVDDPKAMMVLLGTQAKELAQCFKVIAAWARDLAGRFHDAQGRTSEESTAFTEKFEAAVQWATTHEKQLEEDLKKATEARKELESTRDDLRTATIALIWFPLAAAATGAGWGIIQKQLDGSRDAELEAIKQLQIAERELKKKTSQKERAEYVSSKAAALVQVLMQLEVACNGIAAFWTTQANMFNSQGAKMKTNQALGIQVMKKPIVRDNIEVWTKMKELMDRYATAMTVIGNSFNFGTSAKPPPSKVVKFTNLDLTLHVPSTVEYKE